MLYMGVATGGRPEETTHCPAPSEQPPDGRQPMAQGLLFLWSPS